MSSGKRKRVDIDLTGDTNDDWVTPSRSSKQQRQSSQSTSQPSQLQRSQVGTELHRTPSSSHYESVYQQPAPANGMHSQDERQDWLRENEDDVNEIMGSTQDAAQDTDQLQSYGELDTKIVGVQYYRGFASPSEVILVRREPGNPYDSNALRIDNVSMQQIGHIPRRTAEKLAKYIDNRWLHVEGKLAGSIGQFDCPLTLTLYGQDPGSDAGRTLQERMKADKLPLKALRDAERAEKQRQKAQQDAEKRCRIEENKERAKALRAASIGKGGGGLHEPQQHGNYANQSTPDEFSNSQPVMADIIEASQRLNPRDAAGATDQYGMQEQQLQNMPFASKPDAIKTEMLPYQLQALKWLLDQESPSMPGASNAASVQLWKAHPTKANAYTNLATNYSVQGAPKLASGGILADDMGLGKTLEMISLLVADNAKAGKKTGTTLIVSPLSVMSNWSDQIARHVHETHALNVYTYHGSGRVTAMKAKDFAEYDVVITTYQTLAADFMPRGKGASKQPSGELRSSGLYSMDWRRIILDEGHTVRNPSSKGAAAVSAVKAQSHWVLTGTPIVNSLKDLYCLLRFVGITGGLDQLEVFNSVLVRPLKASSPDAIFLLQAIMAAFTLRRKKEMKFIDLKLPALEEYKAPVTFTDKEKERYDAFEQQAKGQLAKFENKNAGGDKAQAFQSLLEVLLRMRQCCNHWQLCGERVQAVMTHLEAQGTVKLNDETKKGLQDILQIHIESQQECAVCLESLHNPVITTCGHFFGRECISKVIETQHKCPMCRAQLESDSCLVEPANDCGDESKDDEMDLNASSSKLESLLSILSATKAKGEGEKTVVFSQWTRFLDIVEARLIKEGYKYCRIDGTMRAAKRDAALHALESDDDTTIMLASLGVCAVGLNLTAANQIILSDSWWAPAIEDQAVDRVHRLGQKRECRVWRLVVEGTIEDAVLGVQGDKRKLMRLAFGEKKGKRDDVKQGRLADIQRLLRGRNGGQQQQQQAGANGKK